MDTKSTNTTKEAWLQARRELLTLEKEHTRRGDELAARRRALPWIEVEQEYTFDTDRGPRTLGDLFEGRRQLIVYHFMMGPDWETPCKSCSFWADHFGVVEPHLKARDVSLVAVSRAELPKLQAFARRMGWSHNWVSTAGNTFNHDFHTAFTPEELEAGAATYNYSPLAGGPSDRQGVSVFFRDEEGTIFHTYSCYARGAEVLNGTYHFLDLVPLGRNEEGLPSTMSWVRFKDEYDQ